MPSREPADVVVEVEAKRVPTLSVVMPALNEEANVRRAVESARRVCCSTTTTTTYAAPEVIVVDGGSDDDTVAEARKAGATVVSSPRGRATQCNVGAQHATGDILIFLHADSTLPPSYDVHVRRLFTRGATARTTRRRRMTSADEEHGDDDDGDGDGDDNDASPQWGTFLFRLGRGGDDGDGDDDGDRLNLRNLGRRLVEMCVNLRAKLFRMPYGDQGLIIRRTTFDAVGGFPSMPFMEDFALVRRLRWERGAPAVVPLPVTTSPRRWDAMGLLRVTAVNQLIVWGYVCGVPVKRLARWYKAGRDMGGGGGGGAGPGVTPRASRTSPGGGPGVVEERRQYDDGAKSAMTAENNLKKGSGGSSGGGEAEVGVADVGEENRRVARSS